MAKRRKYVAYLRTSTGRQTLGIEAQREGIGRFINGGAEVVAEYVEHESGKRDDRPQIGRALERCELTGATLVVATLDRLTRNVAFLETVKASGVKFQCADMPDADSFMLGIMAQVAEYERKQISRRTKAALAAAKANGTKLGSPIAAETIARYRDPAKATEALVASANSWAEKRRNVIEDIRSAGITSASAIARELNVRSIETPRGGHWSAVQVQRLLSRF